MKRFLVLFLFAAFLLTGCGKTEKNKDDSIGEKDGEVITEEAEDKENSIEVVVYEDDIFKATYTGNVDMSAHLKGMGAVGFLLENKTDQEITVYPYNTSVDDFVIMFTSGVPATMQPGKKMNQVWMFVDEDMEFEKFELSFWAKDENFNSLVETDIFSVQAK